ncbi:MAG: hypothetical protein ACPGGK_14660 [Pikeienuella sp.]
MPKALMLFVIGLILGGGAGVVGALSLGAELDGHAHGETGHEVAANAAHDHSKHGEAGHGSGGHAAHGQMISLPDDGAAPTLTAELTADPMSGWNLHVMVENFEFAPKAASGPHVAGQGHAHVYIDGDKIGRLYGAWMHIGSIPADAKQVTVSLNANDHGQLAVGGLPLIVSIPIPQN